MNDRNPRVGPGSHDYGTLFKCCHGRKPKHRDFCPEGPEDAPSKGTEPPDKETQLHELRVLLYEYGWDSVGKPQDWLRIILQDRAALLARLEAAEARAAQMERERDEAIAEREDAWKAHGDACAELERHCETCPRVLESRAREEALAEALRMLVQEADDTYGANPWSNAALERARAALAPVSRQSHPGHQADCDCSCCLLGCLHAALASRQDTEQGKEKP